MSALLALPNELLLEVFQSAPNLQTALHLSCANERLQTIWLASKRDIVNAILRVQLPAYDEALVLAIAEMTNTFKKLSDLSISMQALVPILMRNAKMCSKVCALFVNANPVHHSWTDRPVDLERTARLYYMTRQIVHAFEQRPLRRLVRRKLKRTPQLDIDDHQGFIDWWVNDMADPDIRLWHDMGPHVDACEFKDIEYLLKVPEKWHFTTDTVTLYRVKPYHVGVPIGCPGLYSNASGIGYQPDWW